MDTRCVLKRIFYCVVDTLSNKKVNSTASVPTMPLEPEQIPNILDIQYTPTVLMRHPKTNYSPDEPFPAYAAMVIQKWLIEIRHHR